MAEEKKKIDLKSRLPRRSMAAPVGAPSGSVLPPPAGAIPAPVLPPPKASGGVPAPPFATPSQRPSGPLVDASNPFGAVKASDARRPQPREIKVDVGVEALEAARATRKYLAAAGLVGALVGLGLGWALGGSHADSVRERSAIEGAGLLAQDVEKSNAQIKALSDKIGSALGDLRQKKFPESFASDLGGLNVPFDGDKLVGKGVGSYDQKTLNMLFQYVADVQALNSRKDALRGLFAGQKQAIKDALEAGQNPTVGYTMVVTHSQNGAVGSLAPLDKAFAYDKDWPKQLTIVNTLSGGEHQGATRYESGDVFSSQARIVSIPIEPKSISAAFPNDISARVLSELAKTSQLLSGAEGGPDEESRPGLLKNGGALAEALKKIGEKK